MKKILLDSIINNIKKYYNYDDKKLLEIRYGLESLLLSLFKIIVIVAISFIFKTTKELLLFLLTYGLLRLTGFGVHAKKSSQCWYTSIPIFTLIPYLIDRVIIHKHLLTSILFISLVVLAIYAPADTEKRPLINKKKRKIYKVITIIISIIYMVVIVAIKNNYIVNLLFFSIILETILVIPITYRILGVKYDNYKRYRGRRIENESIC